MNVKHIKEMINHVAIKQGDNLYIATKPCRHYHLIKLILKEENIEFVNGEQGFVDEFGNFINRKDAAKIAIDSGQISELKWSPSLFSEDLW